MKKGLLVLVISLFALSGYCQKFGHVDKTEVFNTMPEKAEAVKALEEYGRALENQMLERQKQYKEKVTEYQENAEKWSSIIKEDKEGEIYDLQQRIQNFQSKAQQDIAQKEASLLEPIYKKITDAIKKVGEEKKLTYIFDSEAILYNSSDSIDVTSDVKGKLGIKN